LRAHRAGGHCGSSALRDLLEHHELDFGAGPLTEAQTLLFSGGISILFSETAGAGLGMYLLGRSHSLEVDLCATVGAGCEQRSTDDPALAWSWVQDEIDAGRPLMVWADIGHLDYLDVRMHNSNHDVIAVGYDLHAGYVMLADHALADMQLCRLESFAIARASEDFPGPHGRRTWFIDWPDALPPADEALARALRGAAERLLDGEAAVPHTTGLPALAELRASIDGWDELEDLAVRERFRRLSFCVRKAGTGDGFFRVLWSEGLHETAGLVGDTELRRLAELYGELAREWTEFATEGLGRDRRRSLPAAAARAAHIAALEEEGARGLAAWSGARAALTPATKEER
jgi:hypothetical protein